ncbi:MAG: TetR-like C-terminal domain-containing protein, partial [Candidatus Limnocylindrales bacterium]
ALATPGGMTILGSLLAQEQRDPELIAAFRARVFEPRHVVVRAVLTRGIEAGDVDPKTPIDVVVDLLFGALLARAILGEPVTNAWLAGVVEVAMNGAAPDRADRS